MKHLHPYLYTLVHNSLEIESEAEIFCLPDQGINAFAIVDTTTLLVPTPRKRGGEGLWWGSIHG